MIWVDYTLLGLLVMVAATGLLRGFKAELYATLLWMLGSGVGLFFCREFSVFLGDVMAPPALKLAAAFISLLAITLVLGRLIGYLLGDLLSCTNFFSRLLGLFVGVARGLLMIAIIVMLAGLTPLPAEPWWHEAHLIFPFQKGVLRLRNRLPTDLAKQLNYE
jgi:membrane protein required for colicin V production